MSEVINVGDFYRPNRMQSYLHNSDATYQCAWGGADSGKSWWATFEGLFLSYDFPNNEGIVLRYSYRELKDYSIPKYIEFAQKMGIYIDYRAGDDELWVKSRNSELRSVIKFRSIKESGARQEQSSKFGSTEIGWFHIEESQDPRIKETVWHMLVKRLRRKDNMPIRPFRRGMITCNPPTPDHWVYRVFWHLLDDNKNTNGDSSEPRVARKGDYEIFLTSTMENRDRETNKPLYDEENLEKLLGSFSPAWQQVYIYGKPAFIPIGRPVWTNFDPIANGGEFEPEWNRRIIRSWDFGRRRSCVIFAQILRVRDEKIYGLTHQRPPLDRITYLRELIFEGKTTFRMADEVTAYSNEEFADWKFDDVGDFTGNQRKAEHEKSSFEILRSKGISIRGRPMQHTRAKCIEIIEEKMAQRVLGIPLIQVDERRCPILTESLSGSWTRDDKGEPQEDNYYEHPSDCAIFVIANFLISGQNPHSKLEIAAPRYRTSRKALVMRG